MAYLQLSENDITDSDGLLEYEETEDGIVYTTDSWEGDQIQFIIDIWFSQHYLVHGDLERKPL